MADKDTPNKKQTYQILIDQKPFRIESSIITGAQIKELADVKSEYGVWQEIPGQHEDRQIEDQEEVNLAEPGAERFFTGKKETTEGLGKAILPSTDRQYLNSKGYDFEEIDDGKQKGLVIKKYPLPANKFDHTEVNLLIILPTGYPDISPDMFYLKPWVKLVEAGTFANRADKEVNFNGESWQRWSRHSKKDDWRPGIDGIHTMINRIKHALEVATP